MKHQHPKIFHMLTNNKLFNRYEYIKDSIETYFENTVKPNASTFIETFYQKQRHIIEEPYQLLLFKKRFSSLKALKHDLLFDHIKYLMTTSFHVSPTRYGFKKIRDLPKDMTWIIEGFYEFIETCYNDVISTTILYVSYWHPSLLKFKPSAFVIGMQSSVDEYQEACLINDVLCFSKKQYESIKHIYQQPSDEIYFQYIKRHLKHQRDVHIWRYHKQVIQHLQTEEEITYLNRDTMMTQHQIIHQHKTFILPIPEDLIELERWSNNYLQTNQYILWIKNDALLTHYKSIPKNFQVIIDINVICQEILNINPLEPLSLNVFKYDVVPLLRDIHQTFRIKKMKHYLYGYALSQNDILHRCLTLGFRHLIIHMPYLHTVIDESLKFNDAHNHRKRIKK